MRAERIEGGSRECRVVAAMTCDDLVLAQVAPKWKRDLMRSPWAGQVGDWCVEYYAKYSKAPNRDLIGMYSRWAETSQDRATSELVGEFLRSVSDEWDKVDRNSKYLLDLATEHFDAVGLEKMCNLVRGDLAAGDYAKAKERVRKQGSFEFQTDAGVDVLTDADALRMAFEKKSHPIVELPGAIGYFMNPALERDSLVAIMARHKIGKTYFLAEIAYQAATVDRRRVAFFQVGDLSEGQMLMRFGVRASCRPYTSKVGWPCRVRLPRGITLPSGSPIADVVYDEEVHDYPLSLAEAVTAFEGVQRTRVRSKSSFLKLFTYPNSSISVKGIEAVLDQQERRGWVADVVVIDYADILAPIDRKEDKLERVNSTWKALRALSQQRHILVLTASQTSKESFKARVITNQHGTEYRVKFDHLTACFGLNQEEEEKERGIIRVNCPAAREFEFIETRCCHVAGSLAVANPMMCSTL